MSQSLQTLLEGIYSSVLEARRFVNEQHLKLFQSYFEKKIVDDPDTGSKVEVYSPRLLAMAMSKGVGENETHEIIEAPALTLVPLSSLAIETLDIEFEAKLTNLEFVEEPEKEKDEAEEALEAAREASDIISRTIDDLFGTSAEIKIMPKSENLESHASPAKVKVSFKISEPPEGVHLMQEKLLDYLRN